MVTRDIIYTGCIEGNASYMGGKPWASLSCKAFRKYAAHIGADLIIIDSSNPHYVKCLEPINFLASQPGNEALMLDLTSIAASYSSIFAIMDFVRGPHERFFWLDLDLAFNHFDCNIFDFFKTGFTIPQKSTAASLRIGKSNHLEGKLIGRELYAKHLPIQLTNNHVVCGSHIFSLDKSTARQLLNCIDVFCIESRTHWEFLQFIHSRGGHCDDETIFELCLNNILAPFQDNKFPTRISPLIIEEHWHSLTSNEKGEITNLTRLTDIDFFMFHFRGDTLMKNSLVNFYREVSSIELNDQYSVESSPESSSNKGDTNRAHFKSSTH